jgi:hypothetical protein
LLSYAGDEAGCHGGAQVCCYQYFFELFVVARREWRLE